MSRTIDSFGMFADMLDGTFQALIATFRALLGVTHHFGQLQSFLGLGFLFKSLVEAGGNASKALTNGGNLESMDIAEFERFNARGGVNSNNIALSNGRPKSPTWFRLMIMFLMGIGVFLGSKKLAMWFLGKIQNNTRRLQEQQQQQRKQRGGKRRPIKARTMYDFVGEKASHELSFSKNEPLLILDRSDTNGWWVARDARGTTGLVPSNYVELLEEDEQEQDIAGAEADIQQQQHYDSNMSRTGSMDYGMMDGGDQFYDEDQMAHVEFIGEDFQ
eukprot:GEZU01005604.1.p1 GENE.GEZU01005604.1~~GEZU01005604.1.p1  ORF type:complete len:274 (+),score=76.87 GEZU01005604.1:795-1616(+)